VSGLQDATKLLVLSRSTLVGLWFNTAAPFLLARKYTLCLQHPLPRILAGDSDDFGAYIMCNALKHCVCSFCQACTSLAYAARFLSFVLHIFAIKNQ